MAMSAEPGVREERHLVVVGTNHRSGSVRLRERLFLDEAAVPGLLDWLRGAGLEQAVVLSTCDRVEVQAAHADPDTAGALIRQGLARASRVAAAEMDGALYCLTGPEAARHIFAVAASLDSQVIGEAQVLGQIKDSHRLSRDAGMTGPEIEAALQAAYATAKRVRSETDIAERPVTIAAVAARIAEDIHGDLARCAALLIGDSYMGDLLIRHFGSQGVDRVAVAAPTEARAQALARDLDCHVASFDDLAGAVANADIVVCAAAGRRHVLTPDIVEAALKARKRRPVFLVDAAVPGDIDPTVDAIDDAFRYDLDDLERVAGQARQARQSAAGKAWKIIDAEVAAFMRRRSGRAAGPAIQQLRSRFEDERTRVLQERPDADAEDATRLLVNRLLHDPSDELRRLAEDDRRALPQAESLLRRLFRLGAGGKSGHDAP